ncbi:GrpE protein [Nitrosococcus halophilus Nc 4]|uniref:Protein GrpE n=1 Tax=Nitrosococcus halophilus (strain Nc4) TaxID=472759 RepID=D5BWE4_NITHN|nr:nucleotide exchange factor GrpE [Nitrosococcus halophilus]ADE15601.1 GrpE protein [Nitrosococcus halophilus Nc 4]
MDQAVKEELIAQFRAYLEQAGDEPALEEEAFSLLAELSGLRTEVKRESRQVKEALEQFKSVFATLQAGNESLSRELESRRAAEKTLWRQTLRPLLLELLDLRDRLEAGLELEIPSRRPLLPGLCRRQNQLLESLREGQGMTLRRLDRILGDYRVRALEVLDKPLDPHTMRVLEVEFRPDQAQGIVTGELRKGFLWDEELLRPAEVKVNKRDDKP